MPYEVFLALRYLRSRRRSRRSLRAHFTAVVAVVGIAFGVAALTLALALANGFQDEMQDKILRGTAHITLARTDNQRLTDHAALRGQLRRIPGVVDASATMYTGALLSTEEAAHYAILRGIDPSARRAVAEVQRALVTGSIDPLLGDPPVDKSSVDASKHTGRDTPCPSTNSVSPCTNLIASGSVDADLSEDSEEVPLAEVLIGVELAARANLHVDDRAELIISEGTGSLDTRALRRRPIRIAGTFRFGLYEYDATWIYVSLARTGFSDTASVISLEAINIYETPAVAERVRAVVGGGYTVVDWQQANQALFAALALERRVVWLVIALIIITAALNITTTLMLVAVERQAEIAILGTMGARPASIVLIFMLEGALVGLIGTLTGVVLGLGLCFIGDYFALIRLPADVYSINQVPFHPRARDVLLTAVAAFIVSLLATIYPARTAARVRPAEALRYEG